MAKDGFHALEAAVAAASPTVPDLREDAADPFVGGGIVPDCGGGGGGGVVE
jgi:hypothetical protein